MSDEVGKNGIRNGRRDAALKTARHRPGAERRRTLCEGGVFQSDGLREGPGGYAVLADKDVAQFTLNDARDPAEIYAAIRRNRQEVVFKNWDRRI